MPVHETPLSFPFAFGLKPDCGNIIPFREKIVKITSWRIKIQTNIIHLVQTNKPKSFSPTKTLKNEKP